MSQRISQSRMLCSAALLGLMAGLSAGCAPRPRGLDGPNADAIEDATMIEFPSDRLRTLGHIAERGSLSQDEQTYLVDAILAGGFSDDQASALIALIENPVCTGETSKYISKQLHWIRLGAAHDRVADALDTRRQRERRRAERNE